MEGQTVPRYRWASAGPSPLPERGSVWGARDSPGLRGAARGTGCECRTPCLEPRSAGRGVPCPRSRTVGPTARVSDALSRVPGSGTRVPDRESHRSSTWWPICRHVRLQLETRCQLRSHGPRWCPPRTGGRESDRRAVVGRGRGPDERESVDCTLAGCRMAGARGSPPDLEGVVVTNVFSPPYIYGCCARRI